MAEEIINETVVARVVDLDLPPGERWRGVIEQDLGAARELFKAAGAQINAVPGIVRDGFGVLFDAFDGPYREELQAWADALGESFGTLAMVNCGYELDHFVFESFLGRLFACTAGVCEVGSASPAHVRTLDWPISGMGEGTRLIEFRRSGVNGGGPRRFVSVGFPGFVGVLSGMVPGGYSVTINWAPPVGRPDFHWGPSFLLRRVLEECDSYADAVKMLSLTRLSTSVFYTVCGVKPGEGCVIERASERTGVRALEARGGASLQVQANHHVHGALEGHNRQLAPYFERTKDPLVESTFRRRANLEGALEKAAGGDLLALLGTLSTDEVANIETTQRMVMRPATGELVLDRFLGGEIGPGKTSRWGRSSHRFGRGR